MHERTASSPPRALLAFMLVVVVLALPHNAQPTLGQEEEVRIVVTFSSLGDEVELLLGESCPHTVYAIARGEVDPHTYTLTPRDLEKLMGAHLIISTEHTSFEKRIKQLVERGEVGALYLGTRSLTGVRILSLPASDAPNLHFPIYHLDNYRIFLQALSEYLEKLCPQEAGTIREKLDNILERLDEVKERVQSLPPQTAVASIPPAQYALEGLGVRVVHILVTETEAGASPDSLERARNLLQEGGMAAIVVVPAPAGGLEPSTTADRWLEEQARVVDAIVIRVPHPLAEGSVLEKLELILGQLEASSTVAAPPVSGVGGETSRQAALALLAVTGAVVAGMWLLGVRLPAARPSPAAVASGLLLPISLVALTASCHISACTVAWIASMVGAGASLGGLSVLMGVRRLFFLAAAVPHAALLSASLGLLASDVLGGGYRVWGVVFNIVLTGLAWRLTALSHASERRVALLLGSMGSLSVIVLYHLAGRLGVGFGVASIVLGDPLLVTGWAAALVVGLGLGVLLYVGLTFREHTVIGVNRPQALLSGLRVSLYDASLALLLGVAGFLLLEVVGFILSHILFLLPGSAALSVARRGSEAVLVGFSLSLSSSMLALALSLASGLSPSGLLGVVVMGQFALLMGVGRRA